MMDASIIRIYLVNQCMGEYMLTETKFDETIRFCRRCGAVIDDFEENDPLFAMVEEDINVLHLKGVCLDCMSEGEIFLYEYIVDSYAEEMLSRDGSGFKACE